MQTIRQGHLLWFLGLTLACASPVTVADDDPCRGPWGKTPVVEAVRIENPPPQNEIPRPFLQHVALKSIVFFQKVISPTDGDRCAMFPSCSTYGAHAFKKHGFLLGTVMTASRLIHERGEMAIAPKIWINGAYRFYDPLENNDFWLTID